MKFKETPLAGVWLIEPEIKEDERGFFTRVFCANEFRKRDLCVEFTQWSLSSNHKKGTLRGLHYQAEPHQEVKIVRCIKGAIYDVVLDLRKERKTYLQSFGIILSEANRQALYIPEGCAHGFQSLEDGSEVLYHISKPYHAESYCGCRWNDPAFGIEWPLEVSAISSQDRERGDYRV